LLFDPVFLIREPLMMLAALGIILLVKPLIALLVVAVLGYSVRTALTVALGLAQIGEFSFILSDLARKHGLMPDAGHTVLVGGAILSITLNPILFRQLDRIERWLKRRPRLWALLNARAERRLAAADADELGRPAAAADPGRRLAVVVGFGPVGRTVDRLLREAGLTTVVIDTNMDTVGELRQQGQAAVFGDAGREAILQSAGVDRASHLVLTLPQSTDRVAIVSAARALNPRLKIFVRARYLRERGELELVGATAAIFEEAEAAVALARLVLADAGARRESIETAVRDIRTRLILDNVTTLRGRPVRTIMVPWTRVRRLTTTTPADQVRRQVGEQRYSRWPVVDAATRLPVGYLLAKDLIGLPADGTAWTGLVRPLGIANPNDDVESVLQYFQREGATICLVEENGTPVGVVTVEDILEQVVGRMEDEYPRHPKVSLRDQLVTDAALLNLTARTSEHALTEMAARIPSARLPAGADVAGLAIAREREMHTALGHGIAVPHARVPGLARSLVVFGRSADGVVFDPESPDLVHLIFLLVTPAEQPTLQVFLLAQVARVAGDPVTRERLRTASPAEVEAIVAALPADGPPARPPAATAPR
jgi:mannitol/fructose-specific phosphotransferase system IIA component (Ntr-type)/voltage-gated potassium channel Kch